MTNPPDPSVTERVALRDLGNGVTRDMTGEDVLGFRVAAYRETHPEHGDTYGHRYSEHWSTPNSRDPRVKVERLFTEDQLRAAISSMPSLEEENAALVQWLRDWPGVSGTDALSSAVVAAKMKQAADAIASLTRSEGVTDAMIEAGHKWAKADGLTGPASETIRFVRGLLVAALKEGDGREG